MQNNHIISFLGLKEENIRVTKVKNNPDHITISMKVHRQRPRICKDCGCDSFHYHDQRIQRLRDIPYANKPVFFDLKRVRYKCSKCKSSTYVNPNFLMKKSQITKRLYFWILKEYTKIKTISDISRECGLSVTSIFRYIDNIKPRRLELPEVLCIDEFKGDSGKEKYQVNISDGKNHKIIDILPCRYKDKLIKYFSRISKIEREKVKYFVSDMSKTFKEIQEIFFPNAIHVVDKYHFIRQVTWALERVRKTEQKKMSYNERLFFKRSKSLLSKPMNKLRDEEKIKVSDMLEQNKRIHHAYLLKEIFYLKVLKSKDKKTAEVELDKWIKLAKTSGEKEFKPCITAFTNWREGIQNSFNCKWTNGYVEGTHNRIKTIKRISFGMPNFHHFRTKILFVFS